MALKLPLVLKIPQRFEAGGLSLDMLLSRLSIPWSKAWSLRGRFQMSPAEKRFAQELLRRHSRLHLFRCDQRSFCGDFVVIDMSCPDPQRRRAWVIELKSNQRLKRAAGGVQLRRAAEAVLATEMAQEHQLLLGDPAEVLAAFERDH